MMTERVLSIQINDEAHRVLRSRSGLRTTPI
jgi:hypothetical protein